MSGNNSSSEGFGASGFLGHLHSFAHTHTQIQIYNFKKLKTKYKSAYLHSRKGQGLSWNSDTDQLTKLGQTTELPEPPILRVSHGSENTHLIKWLQRPNVWYPACRNLLVSRERIPPCFLTVIISVTRLFYTKSLLLNPSVPTPLPAVSRHS